eukprot:3163674-Rhodomonas_salina.2
MAGNGQAGFSNGQKSLWIGIRAGHAMLAGRRLSLQYGRGGRKGPSARAAARRVSGQNMKSNKASVFPKGTKRDWSLAFLRSYSQTACKPLLPARYFVCGMFTGCSCFFGWLTAGARCFRSLIVHSTETIQQFRSKHLALPVKVCLQLTASSKPSPPKTIRVAWPELTSCAGQKGGSSP